MQGEIITDGLTLRPIAWKTEETLSDSQYDVSNQALYLKRAKEANPKIFDDVQEIKRVMDKMIDSFSGNRVCWGAFYHGELIGYVNIIRPEGEMPMLQYEMKKAFQRRGYGFEAATGVLETYWVMYPGKSVFAMIRPDNEASIALVKKLNGVLIPAGSPLEEMLFSTYKLSMDCQLIDRLQDRKSKEHLYGKDVFGSNARKKHP